MAYLYFALAGLNAACAFAPSNTMFWANAGGMVAFFGYGLVEALKKGR